MHKRMLLVVLTIILTIGILASCERFVPPDNNASTSKANDDESHFSHTNCMSCHYTEGRGEGWFTVAGTVTGNWQDATIEVRTAPNETGTLLHSLEIDALGNFYTTSETSFANGVYVGVKKGNTTIWMEDVVHTGSCNMCHGTEITPNLVID